MTAAGGPAGRVTTALAAPSAGSATAGAAGGTGAAGRDRSHDAGAGAAEGSAEDDGEPAPRPIPLLPGDPTLARRLRFALVTACTLSSLALGMTAIFLSLHGSVRAAALCLIGCIVFDAADGPLARRLGVASPFGMQMDSMADMCSFGIATPVMVYAWLHHGAPAAAVGAACALIAACAAIRLARFNISPKDGRFFCGVPTTMVASVLVVGTLIGLHLPAAVMIGSVVLLALAMVSGFPYAKLNRVAKLPSWSFLVPAVGTFVDYRLTFVGLVALYLASGPLLWLRQRPHSRPRVSV